MVISNRLLVNSDCYRTNRTITPKGVMVHSTGVAQPNPEVFIRAWNKPGVLAATHGIVSKEGVFQLLPWNHRGWHAGKGSKGSANNTHISFEICEPAGHTYRGGTMVGYDPVKNAGYFEAIYRNAVELTAMLCTMYKLNPLAPGVVICHREGHTQGVASNHSDVMQWFPKHGKSMDTFRQDVAKAMKGEDTMTPEQFDEMMDAYLAKQREKPVSGWAKEAWEKAVSTGVFDGTAPHATMTREQAAVVLDRLGLLE